MKLKDLLEKVEKSQSLDWQLITLEGEKRIWIYKDDINLRIESNHDDINNANMQEEWLEKYGTHSSSISKNYLIYHQNIVIAKVALINMDGGRVDFPHPNLKDKTVDEFEYHLSEIVSQNHPSKYLDDSNFSIAPSFSVQIVVDTGFEENEENLSTINVKRRKHY